DEAQSDRVLDIRKHDRHSAGRLLQCSYCRCAAGKQYVRAERDQLARGFAQAVRITQAPADVDPHVAAVGPTKLLESLDEGRDTSLAFRVVRGQGTQEKADPTHSFALLSTRGDGPARCRTANNLHEITSLHYHPRSKTMLFGIQLPSSKQKIATSETGLNAQCALQTSRAAHASDGSDPDLSRCLQNDRFPPRKRTSAERFVMSQKCH